MREQRCPHSLLTIGHSKHPIEKFLELLRQHGVEVLVDARSQPFSRFSPHFSRKARNQLDRSMERRIYARVIS